MNCTTFPDYAPLYKFFLIFAYILLGLIPTIITIYNTLYTCISLYQDEYKDRKEFIEDFIWPLKLYRNYKKLPSSYEEPQIGFRILK